MPLRKPANLPYPRLPAPTGPNFKGLFPLFLQYKNDSNMVYKQLNAISIDTERPKNFHFKVIGLLCMYHLPINYLSTTYLLPINYLFIHILITKPFFQALLCLPQLAHPDKVRLAPQSLPEVQDFLEYILVQFLRYNIPPLGCC